MLKYSVVSAACLFMFSALVGASDSQPSSTVTFVCEHGSAKSVIAAAYFNKIAESQGLKYRAVSRGMVPDQQLQPATQAGLTKDGLDTTTFIPTKLSVKDAQQSLRVVTIGIAHEPQYLRSKKLAEWDEVPPVSKGYAPARDDMVMRIKSLIAELQAAEK